MKKLDCNRYYMCNRCYKYLKTNEITDFFINNFWKIINNDT